MSMHLRRIAAMTAMLVATGSAPAMAWEQLNLETSPSGKATFNDLPGVGSNRGLQKTPSGDCRKDQYFSSSRSGFDSSGTVTECNYGNFSLRTYNSGSGSASTYNPFPVPGPLSNDGPPPGSGGFAPVQRW